jgi:transcriptional regulator GlxA family with amidase domain
LVQLLDVTGPFQVFASTNDLVREAGGRPPYDLRVVARSGAQVMASAGLNLSSRPLPSDGVAVDTLMVAGGQGVEAAAADPVIIEWVQKRAKRARRIASVCTGAFLLAASGLLDGRRAATHWSYCAELARRFPKVRVESDPIFVRDGPVWSSAGVTAGIDLALALVEEDLGPTLALAVARYLVEASRWPSAVQHRALAAGGRR